MIGIVAGNPRSRRVRRAGLRLVPVVLAMVALSGCGHMMMMLGNGMEPPPESEFGYGPRSSANGIYEAVLEPGEPLRVRRLQTVKLTVRGADHSTVDGARIAVDGGMPQHGHGLPTQPRVTAELGGGAYQIDGVRFNMGGWWELRFAIATATGTDTVTFNLKL
jgi:hypothetical protein